MRTFTADRGDAKLRLDQAIVRRLSDVHRLSRTRVQRWIDDRLVLVNDRPARRAAAAVAAGDRVAVLAADALETIQPPAAEHAPIDILYEDEHVLALNKPAGIVAHPAYKHAAGTLLNAALGHVARTGRGSTYAALVHRLDKDTSGVLLVAKSPEAHGQLQRFMTGGRTLKIYLAVVSGRPRARRGTIAFPLGRDPNDRRRVVVLEDGRTSTTRYEVRRRGREMSLLQCELVTGRTHQIRVHLAASGWPIVGDTVYGRASAAIGRQALHAWRLTFPHPATGLAVEVVAPPPEDLARLFAAQNFTL